MADSRVSLNQNTHHFTTAAMGAYNQLENSFGNATGSLCHANANDNNQSFQNVRNYLTRPDSLVNSHEYSMQKIPQPYKDSSIISPLQAPQIIEY